MVKNDYLEDVFGDGLPFYDLLVFIDSHIDLFKRKTIARAKPFTEEWITKAKDAQTKLETTLQQNRKRISPKTHSERELREFAERELKEFVEKIKLSRERIQTHWNDSKTVSLREKTSFFFGVQNLLGTALLLAFWPEWIPLAYTLEAAFYLPLRVYTYRKLAYHYFLFDICYVINGLCLLFLWVFPHNTILFQACYGLAHGPSAIAIATWRNSLVFHSIEKVTSLFIHIYPALVFTVIRHFYPGAEERFPAIAGLTTISIGQTLTISSTIYIVWQVMYYRFVIVARAAKILQGGRPTSFTYLLNSKTGLISKLLHAVPPHRRAHSFMLAQFAYTIVTMLPALLWFYKSKLLSGLFLWCMFSVSVWNGASFYMEVFGRRFEKELKSLKQEIDKLNKVEAEAQESLGQALLADESFSPDDELLKHPRPSGQTHPNPETSTQADRALEKHSPPNDLKYGHEAEHHSQDIDQTLDKKDHQHLNDHNQTKDQEHQGDPSLRLRHTLNQDPNQP